LPTFISQLFGLLWFLQGREVVEILLVVGEGLVSLRGVDGDRIAFGECL